MEKLDESQTVGFHQADFQTAVRQLLTDRKLTIPAAMLRGVEWIKKDQSTLKLIADLDEPNHLTFRRFDHCDELLSQLAERIRETESPNDAVIALQVLHDRYLPVSLDVKGHRVRLTEEVLVHLGATPGTELWLYLFAKRDQVEVMTPEYRNRRLATWRQKTNLPEPDLTA